MAAKKSQSLREKLTDSIMKNKYGDDDPKYDQDNRNFLNTLSILELERMCEEEFDVDGEDDEDEDDESDFGDELNGEFFDPLDDEYNAHESNFDDEL